MGTVLGVGKNDFGGYWGFFLERDEILKENFFYDIYGSGVINDWRIWEVLGFLL